MITTVLFDFYGTLARAVAWGPSLDEVLGAHGLALTETARERWLAEVFDGQEHRSASETSESYRNWELARLARLARRCGAPPSRCHQMATELYSASKAFTVAAYSEVPGVLHAIRRRGLQVGVCSNWDWALDAAIAQAALGGLVDVAVTSAQAGARKPHPRIFQVALERCRAAADQTLFVGDTWYPDVEGPRALGMPVVHLWRDPPTSSDAPPLPPGVRRGRDLTAVLDALEALAA